MDRLVLTFIRSGRVSFKVYNTYFKAATWWIILIFLASLLVEHLGTHSRALSAEQRFLVLTCVCATGDLLQKFWVKCTLKYVRIIEELTQRDSVEREL